MENLKILIGSQEDGYVFRLHPKSKNIIKAKFPEKVLPAHFFIAFDIQQDFESIQGSFLGHVAPALTNLTEKELHDFGGIQIVNPADNSILWDSNG